MYLDINYGLYRTNQTFIVELGFLGVRSDEVLSHLDNCSVLWSGGTKKGLRKIAISSGQGSTAGPWMYTESNKLIICMSITPGSKWRRD